MPSKLNLKTNKPSRPTLKGFGPAARGNLKIAYFKQADWSTRSLDRASAVIKRAVLLDSGREQPHTKVFFKLALLSGSSFPGPIRYSASIQKQPFFTQFETLCSDLFLYICAKAPL